MNLSKNIKIMKEVLEMEASSLSRVAELLDEQSCERAAHILRELEDKKANLVICGVGKSGNIAAKIASTFSSLGLSSFFLHPTEALHGDLGRVGKDDAIIFISKSGTTEEIMTLIPFIDTPKDRRIALVGNVDSPVARACGLVFDCSVEKEACINNQAPTTSTTVAMAMGDALAVVYENVVELTREGFAVNHPGGLLGKSLRVMTSHLALKLEECPTLSKEATLRDVILTMTKMPVGGCAIVSEDNKLEGIIVEGDIRRAFSNNFDLDSNVQEIMTKTPITIAPEDKAYDALVLMEKREKPITILPVVEGEKFVGFLRLHDLLKAGFLLEK